MRTIHSFIYLFNNILSVYYLLASVLGVGNTTRKETIFTLMDFAFQWRHSQLTSR